MYMSASPPEAPPLSVTTTGCFIRLFFWIAACIMRAIWSEAPPAARGDDDLDRLGGLPCRERRLVGGDGQATAAATDVKYLRMISSYGYRGILTRWHTGLSV
jgi:hypothetical protein